MPGHSDGGGLHGTGGHYHALFALDVPLQARFMEYAEQQGEAFWPLPWRAGTVVMSVALCRYRQLAAGQRRWARWCLQCRGFLSRFVPRDGEGWLHLDLAAAFSDNGSALWAAGATAVGLKADYCALPAD